MRRRATCFMRPSAQHTASLNSAASSGRRHSYICYSNIFIVPPGLGPGGSRKKGAHRGALFCRLSEIFNASRCGLL